MTEPANARTNVRALYLAAADNYVLRVTEATRADDPHGDLNDEPALNPQHITSARQVLADHAHLVDAVEPAASTIYPVIQLDGQILYCRVDTMSGDDVDAALTTLAAEGAWLDHHRGRLVADYAALLKLHDRLNGDTTD